MDVESEIVATEKILRTPTGNVDQFHEYTCGEGRAIWHRVINRDGTPVDGKWGILERASYQQLAALACHGYPKARAWINSHGYTCEDVGKKAFEEGVARHTKKRAPAHRLAGGRPKKK